MGWAARFRTQRLPVVAGALAAVAVGLVAWAVAGGTDGAGPSGLADPGPVHVHALGVNPSDEALFIATHTGLYRVGPGEREARRVSDRRQDTMGFTVVGPDRFLGSGHPDLRDGLPPHLGLIESVDAGVTWQPVSLLGEADFHVLRLAGERVYGYDSSNDRLLVSADRGETWEELEKPGAIVDLAVSPLERRRVVVTSLGGPQGGLFASRDAGRTWVRIADAVGLLAWPREQTLYLVTGAGALLVSADGGRRFVRRGDVGGEPAAFLAQRPDELYVALHDGTVKRSLDGGATWTLRTAP
ncbi:MAG TPA: hypothetical protein VNJ53_05660 [Gaiellaceae bacterium]|nr:hypothetical protein [Gaiellaceae bacterium]